MICWTDQRPVWNVISHFLLDFYRSASSHIFLVLQEDKTAVLVGTITDDVRLFEVPKLTVVAMRVTETARARILGVRSYFTLHAYVAIAARQCMLA